ncbi:GGDEF domain-containing protein [Streptomyces sp. NP160]|uniref:GGDEF domain-containing protein n=1 Tax=Streptomyces sp. NP160 TaxID=2586637 RepID=UPI00111996B8|nr:GGDEF domain-containing protein [Streptomyces sp. NP160]TNM67724.1 GGDEF domain-containing protein [Streptomyces sp. NP160]
MAAGALVVHGLPGPFHAVVEDAGDLLDACDFAACTARCEAALPWVEALGDRSTGRYLRYVAALALVELAELGRAGDLLEDLLGVPAGQDPLWRAKALALAAEVAFTGGRPGRGVEHLAEALDLLDATGSRHVNRLSATMACGLALQAAGAHPEAEVLLRRVLADVPGTPGVSELNVLPELVLLVAERAAGAELRGERAEADRQWRGVLELSLRWRRCGAAQDEPSHVLRSTAAEALAWQRLGDHAAASAAAAGTGLLGEARSGALTGRVEGVMARLHLAGEARYRGDAVIARTHLDEALAETRRTEPGVWAFTALAALAELDAEERRGRHGGGARPDRWQELAQALLVRTAASSRALVSELEARRRARRAAAAHDAAALAVLTDALTGVANRRGLDEALAAAAAEGAQVAACFVDVDRFKDVNDGFSHEVGDEVLRRVAALLVEVTRGQDLVARYGGDEFVVLSAHPRDLAALGQRVVDEVGSLPWAQVAPGLRVTVSVGVTGPMPARAVLSSADAAMLDAKRRGRSRAVVRRAS